MRVDILTIFPGMFSGPLTESLLKKAREKNIIDIRLSDIRSFTDDKHHSVDDRPFGGGPGMVMKPEPIYRALKNAGVRIKKNMPAWPKVTEPLAIYLSPQGRQLNQDMVRRLARYRRLVLLCGHYEGVDERALAWLNQEISIGDFVLTGGELPAMVLIDSVVRMLPGVVKEADSVERDSFYNGLLDYPHFTRPAKYRGRAVPEILFSGHHSMVEQWRREQSLCATLLKRPDLLAGVKLSDKDKDILAKYKKQRKVR
ncbi:MAG: tRNA (guanosine(37)-N1)-methyltransferase TrmD [Elusimicrobia bacterium RIFOXYB2_FULL_49_7]|nr:MAG: tRNA (guanosine(37)-N1)-methyltransferase TrmD [Elusimicrobia bacterium RIFOXYB2_FULL_49_7]